MILIYIIIVMSELLFLSLSHSSKAEKEQFAQWKVHKSIFKAAMKGDLASVRGMVVSNLFCTFSALVVDDRCIDIAMPLSYSAEEDT